jgi:UDP-N-acetyl-D-mannosaminuronate dehydrogenase
VTGLGYAYLENSDDIRDSPSAKLVSILEKRGYDVSVHDPFVSEYRGDVLDVLRNSDCTVLMVSHSVYRELDLQHSARLMRQPRLVDARGFFEVDALREAGFHWRVLGTSREAHGSSNDSTRQGLMPGAAQDRR